MNMEANAITELEAGRVFLDHGPISMVISASRQGAPLAEQCISACEVAVACLFELEPELQKLKRSWTRMDPMSLNGIGLKMWQAVSVTADSELTPMAAVAGAVSDRVADWLVAQGATKVIVNNGGDVAIRLMAGETTTVGISPNLVDAGFSKVVRLTSADNIGGIATSGLGGRSFTCGVMESVTVLAKSCAVADAFATSLANSSYIDSPAVRRVLARSIDPDTDIPDLMVTEMVGRLTPLEIDQSITQVKEKIWPAIRTELISACLVSVQGRVAQWPEKWFV